MSVEESFVRLETIGAVATLTLNRPAQFNALSSGMLAALQNALNQVKSNRDARVVVLAGSGRAFCAGHDLREMQTHPDQAWLAALFTRCSSVMMTLAEMPQPVIARVHGVATAAGCQLVAACDLAIAARSARFATSGVNLGLFCSTPAVAMTRAVAAKRAAELLFSGDFIDAERAERWGLINRCVSDADLESATWEWAAAIAAKSRSALASGKALLRQQRELSTADAYAVAVQNMVCDMKTEDSRLGIQAFLDKQPTPDWTHR